jgi:SAM-dependent methyltransferase
VNGPYYRADLAHVHHVGFGFHADRCAPGILALLEPVRARHGLVVELGCGSGILTRHLVDAGHRVIATDASPAMVDLARTVVPDAEAIEVLVLPDDAIPEADAVVSVGHVLCYLPDEAAVEAGLRAAARAVRPGGVLALDLCDLEWGRARGDAPPYVAVEDDWAIVTRFSVPRPERFVRDITVFVRESEGRWRRDDERHDNVLVDVAAIPAMLATEGIAAEVRSGFDDQPMTGGLVAVVGTRADWHRAPGAPAPG